MGLFLCVLAVAFTVWMLPYFMGKNRKLQRRGRWAGDHVIPVDDLPGTGDVV